MSAGHTPGKLVQSHRKGSDGMHRTEIFSEEYGGIATCEWTPKNLGNGVTGTYREANARRLVACWNACGDIDTDELERIAATGGMLGPREDVARIAAQRDALQTRLESGKEVWRQDQLRISDLMSQRDELLKLVERMLNQGQFFLTAVEANDPHTSDFEQWERDARAAIAKATGATS